MARFDLLGSFGRGYAGARQQEQDEAALAEKMAGRKRQGEQDARQARLDAEKSAEEGFNRRKALEFEGSTDPGEVAFRDRMRKKAGSEGRLRDAQASYYESGRGARGEQAVSARIEGAGDRIAELDEQEEAGRGWFNDTPLSAGDVALRDRMRGERDRLILGSGGGASKYTKFAKDGRGQRIGLNASTNQWEPVRE